jgi:hypothetical protein
VIQEVLQLEGNHKEQDNLKEMIVLRKVSQFRNPFSR